MSNSSLCCCRCLVCLHTVLTCDQRMQEEERAQQISFEEPHGAHSISATTKAYSNDTYSNRYRVCRYATEPPSSPPSSIDVIDKSVRVAPQCVNSCLATCSTAGYNASDLTGGEHQEQQNARSKLTEEQDAHKQ